MILSHDFTVDAPLEAVFDALVDPAVTASVHGITLGARTPEGLFRGNVNLSVASGEVRYSGVARVRDADREAGAIALELIGHDIGGGTPARGSVALRLRSAGPSTTVSLLLEVEAGGDEDGAGGEAETAMATLLDRLGEAVRAAVGGEPGSPAAATADALSYGTPWPTAPPLEAGSSPGDDEAEVGDRGDDGSSWQATEEELRGLAELVAQLELEDEVAPQAAAPAAADPVANPPARYATPGAMVPGTVRIVTDGPIDSAHIPVDGSTAARVRATAEERPWLAPALILGTAAVVLVLRRRRPR